MSNFNQLGQMMNIIVILQYFKGALDNILKFSFLFYFIYHIRSDW